LRAENSRLKEMTKNFNAECMEKAEDTEKRGKEKFSAETP